MLKSGVVSITLKEKSIDEVISLAVKAKLAGIEWSENHHIRPGDLAAAALVRKKTEAAGLTVASYGSYCRTGGPDFRKSFSQSLAAARELGAPAIRIWAGDKASGTVSGPDFAKNSRRIVLRRGYGRQRQHQSCLRVASQHLDRYQ